MDRIERLKAKIKEFVTTPGVYLMKNSRGKVIYVGKAKNLKARVRSYFTKSADHSLKTKYLVSQIEEIDFVLTQTEVEAFLLEASLIKKFRPKYNIRLKDDKNYPYLRCSSEVDFPRFYLCRKVKSDGSHYFGPYTNSGSVWKTIRFINRTFRIRDCTDSFMKNRKRPCMTYQIGRCTAPCVDLIDQKGYAVDVANAIKFLKGDDTSLIDELTEKMKKAAEAEQFEVAARLRDSIDAITAIWEKQAVVSTKKDRDQDVIAYFGDSSGTLIETLHVRSGRLIGTRAHFVPRLDHTSADEDEKEWLTSFINQYYSENFIPDDVLLPVDLTDDIYKLLGDVFKELQGKSCNFVHALGPQEQRLMDIAEKNAKSHFDSHKAKRDDRLEALELIKTKLHLPELPQRIECFDISHFQGSENVASQVVFEEGLPRKDDYRRYKIKTVVGSDDFASMKEVLSRRLKHTEYEDPQLIVIDGGKGQLNAVVEVLKELKRQEIPVVGLAKSRTKRKFDDVEVEVSKERFFLPGRQNPVVFSENSGAFKILTGIRDEAHRFAINYHRTLREAVSIESELDHISGLGPRKKQALLRHFKDLDAIRKASVDDLLKCKGMSRVLAERIHLHLSELQE